MTAVSVSAGTLVEGVWFAMEQAGRLLRTAVQVYEAGDFGTAVALAMFAHEELGRSGILLDLAHEANCGGTLAVKDVQQRCGNHREKQRRGAFSIVQRPKRGEPLAAALAIRMSSQPGSPEYAAAQAEIDAATDAERQAQPARRHTDRMFALYLDLSADGRNWLRPALMDRQTGYEQVNDAVNDYSTGRQWFEEPFVSTTDPTLLSINPKTALLRIARPAGLVLVAPGWPTMPT